MMGLSKRGKATKRDKIVAYLLGQGYVENVATSDDKTTVLEKEFLAGGRTFVKRVHVSARKVLSAVGDFGLTPVQKNVVAEMVKRGEKILDSD